MRLVAPLLVLLASACDSGQVHLNFILIEHGSYMGTPTLQGTSPEWGGGYSLDANDEIEITTDLETELHPRVIELLDVSGDPVELSCKTVDITEPDTGDSPHRARTCSPRDAGCGRLRPGPPRAVRDRPADQLRRVPVHRLRGRARAGPRARGQSRRRIHLSLLSS